MARRLDIGIASYRSPEKLKRAVELVKKHSVTDWRLHIVHNPHQEDTEYKPPVGESPLFNEMMKDERVKVFLPSDNRGYAGAVNEILRQAETEYIAYLDNDAYIQTPGWDETLCRYLDRFHEIGMVFPNGGAYPIPRGAYTEIMWAPGFCWVLSQAAMRDTISRGDYDGRIALQYFDESLGHQEECDYSLRLRMAGYKCAAAPEVHVKHDATATSDPKSIERINRGVQNFVNKWTRYFGGKNLNYHSPNVLRWEDWHPNALYLEEYWKSYGLNPNEKPESIHLDGRWYDLIRVPRLKGFYTGRII